MLRPSPPDRHASCRAGGVASLTRARAADSVSVEMVTHGLMTVEPAPEVIAAARTWLVAVRRPLGHDFLAAYLTGSVLTQEFDLAHSRVNLLVVARAYEPETLDALRRAIPVTKKPPHFDPLFMTRDQIEKSLDVFPIEWLEVQERHLRLEGEDLFSSITVPRTYLRLQCEHELRGKHIQLRQAYLLSAREPAELGRTLRATASSFATLFRTLLRLSGESPPVGTGRVIERVADLFELDAQHLLGPHLVRYSGRRYAPEEMQRIYRGFLGEINRLVVAIDRLQVS